MAWKINLAVAAQHDLDDLDSQVRRRILKFLYERLAKIENPRAIGHALTGSKLGNLWRYRVGDHRILCDIQDKKIVVPVLQIGHRREVYR
jgi:mRNA interferase RelE/StbE